MICTNEPINRQANKLKTGNPKHKWLTKLEYSAKNVVCNKSDGFDNLSKDKMWLTKLQAVSRMFIVIKGTMNNCNKITNYIMNVHYN